MILIDTPIITFVFFVTVTLIIIIIIIIMVMVADNVMASQQTFSVHRFDLSWLSGTVAGCYTEVCMVNFCCDDFPDNMVCDDFVAN